MNLTLVGAVSGVNTGETNALVGKKEVQTSNTFTTLTTVALASTAAGTVSVYAQGTAGTGQIGVTSVPADGKTLTFGLTGYTRAYTFRDPCRETILCVAATALVTAAAAASYVKITLNGAAKYFWFSNVSGPTTDPAPGGTGYAVVVTNANDASAVAAALRASMVTNLTNFATSVSTATVTITGIALGAITISQDAGADFTLTAVAAGTADAANQIRTGWHTDGVACTTSNIADYIDRAIDAGATAGTHYGTGTAAHADLTSTVSGFYVLLSDRIAVNRSLAWSFAQSAGTQFSLVDTMSSGVDGTLLASLTTGLLTSFDSFVLDNEALASPLANKLLPALFTGYSDAMAVFGKPILLLRAAAATAIEITYQVSMDQTNWLTGKTNLTDMNANYLYYSPGEVWIAYIRFNVTVNANTVDKAVNLKVLA